MATRLVPRSPTLPPKAQWQVKETAATLRALLASSASAPVLLDPASAASQRAKRAALPAPMAAWAEGSKTSPRVHLPPLPAGPAPHKLPGKTRLPPASASPRGVVVSAAVAPGEAAFAADASDAAPGPSPAPAASSSAEADDGRRRGVNRGGSFANLDSIKFITPAAAPPPPPPPEEGDFDDWQEAQVMVACFWPLHVWKRETAKARTLENQLTTRVADGMARLRLFRTWRERAIRSSHLAKQSAVIRASVRVSAKRRALARVAVFTTRERKCDEVYASRKYRRLRASCLGRQPLSALRCYSVCRALVRKRSFGDGMMKPDELPMPLPVPVEWREDPGLAPIVLKADKSDVARRLVNRHRRHRLGPLLLSLLAINVDLQRKKR